MTNQLTRLTNASVNTPLTIKWFFPDRSMSDYMESVGMVQGADIRIISSFCGHLIVAVNGRRLALGIDIAQKITV